MEHLLKLNLLNLQLLILNLKLDLDINILLQAILNIQFLLQVQLQFLIKDIIKFLNSSNRLNNLLLNNSILLITLNLLLILKCLNSKEDKEAMVIQLLLELQLLLKEFKERQLLLLICNSIELRTLLLHRVKFMVNRDNLVIMLSSKVILNNNSR